MKTVVIKLNGRLEFRLPTEMDNAALLKDVLSNIDSRDVMKVFMSGFSKENVVLVCSSFDEAAGE